MTQQKMVQPSIRRHQEERKELARNQKRIIVGKYKRPDSSYQSTHIK
jgi:hypothetical protein